MAPPLENVTLKTASPCQPARGISNLDYFKCKLQNMIMPKNIFETNHTVIMVSYESESYY